MRQGERKMKKLFNFKFAKSNKFSRNEKQIKMIENVIKNGQE